MRRAVIVSLLLLRLPALLHAGAHWDPPLKNTAAWYATAEAKTLAASIAQYQTPSGGWPKNTDFSSPPSADFLKDDIAEHHSATIDNNATTVPMTYLAKVVTATGDKPSLASFERGFNYLLTAQYENGGWPQFFPIRKGYYTHITYNDDAMVNVLELLRDAAAGRAPYAFLDQPRRDRAVSAVARGIDCILQTQVKQNGELTVWCAQHDEHTLAPAWARNYEPPSLSGSESVFVVRFLMSVEKPSPAIIASVEGAVAWFQKTKIAGQRFEHFTNARGEKDRHITPDPSAPPLWARFYELGTDRPIFIGRDRVIRYALSEIELERRTGYAYYSARAGSLLAKDYPAWCQRLLAGR